MIKPLLVLGLVALVALFKKRAPERTAWTGTGLPTPVATVPELQSQATALAAALRAAPAAAATAGLVRAFQRGAGLLREQAEEVSPGQVPGWGPATQGVYDAVTRQALGWYGQLWQEETP